MHGATIQITTSMRSDSNPKVKQMGTELAVRELWKKLIKKTLRVSNITQQKW